MTTQRQRELIQTSIICSVYGCFRRQIGRGYCARHELARRKLMKVELYTSHCPVCRHYLYIIRYAEYPYLKEIYSQDLMGAVGCSVCLRLFPINWQGEIDWDHPVDIKQRVFDGDEEASERCKRTRRFFLLHYLKAPWLHFDRDLLVYK